ncbi:Protein kinase-like domain protein [Niveomyces insectorum RCEF 264]|uniref:Protein kinase-like domain protein n=1 Tax=Niveomyces insectorum RCEF 264 TaxID=1081102 RepID=A0A167U405_9HYPO|nr:Protein kinase-like domain protein [Niveomyces insectorum RCEF 264]
MATETCSDALPPAPASAADISTFTTDEPKPAETSLAWETFKRPRLHKYPLSIDDLTFEAYVGRGADGVVFKAQGGGQTVAVKVFPDNKPPPPHKYAIMYWAFKRECTNCMLLDKITTRLCQARATGQPVFVHPEPKTHRQALRNLRAFSDEGRVDSAHPPDDGFVPLPLDLAITVNPCLGWMEASGKQIGGVLWRFHKLANFDDAQTYYCIVYNFVESGDVRDLDEDKIVEHTKFFHTVGFLLNTFNFTNWRGDAVLVDFSDLTSPFRKYEWLPRGYANQLARAEQGVRFGMDQLRQHPYYGRQDRPGAR